MRDKKYLSGRAARSVFFLGKKSKQRIIIGISVLEYNHIDVPIAAPDRCKKETFL